MSTRDDALRELAANRGCRLVTSRVRTPGRGDYGKFGLKDAKSGKAVFGISGKRLTATAGDIADFLRGDAAAGWKSSVGKLPRRRKPETRRAHEKEPEPEPELAIRPARPRDAAAIAALISALGYEATEAEVRKRVAAMKRASDAVLVAEQGGLVGCATLHLTPVLHRSKPVGRITMLVVGEKVRGSGIGAALVARAEALLAERGAGMIEVTSNVKRLRAHAFYARLGYERTSYRFAKMVGA